MRGQVVRDKGDKLSRDKGTGQPPSIGGVPVPVLALVPCPLSPVVCPGCRRVFQPVGRERVCRPSCRLLAEQRKRPADLFDGTDDGDAA
jgi:hypothetical protein